MGWLTYKGTTTHSVGVTAGGVTTAVSVDPGETIHLADALSAAVLAQEPSLWVSVAGLPPSPSDVVLGTDGTLGGPGGTSLSASVVSTILPSGDTTGATDTAAIQAQINAVAAKVYPNQGGLVSLAAGTFFINATLSIPADNVTLAGQGHGNPTGNKNTNSNPQYGGTVLTPVAAFTGSYVLKFGQPGTPTRVLVGCFLRDLSIDGQNLPANVNGVWWQVFKGGAQNVYVYKTTGTGIVLDGNGSTTFPNCAFDNHFWNVVADTCSGNGIVLQNGATDNSLMECTAKYCGGHGFYVDVNSPSNRWTGGYSYNNTGKGMQLDIAMQAKIIGVRVQDCNGGIYITCTGDGDFEIVGCTLRNCSYTTDNTTDGINLSASSGANSGLISGNTFTVDQGNGNGTGPNYNRMRYLINVGANCKQTVVSPYSFGTTGAGGSFGTAAFNDAGTNTQILAAVGQSGLPEIKHSGNLRLFWRSGSPAAVVSAGPGSVVLNTAGGSATTLFVKESASDSTGWIGK